MTAVEQITTAEQLLHASDLGRCELLQGKLVMLPWADWTHAAVTGNVSSLLFNFVKRRRLGVVLGGGAGFHIGHNPDTVRAPDAAFIRTDRVGEKLPEGYFPGAPDLAVEVLSADDRAGEMLAKVQDWLDAGCLAVWVVGPRTQTVTVYDSRRQAAVLKTDDTLTGGEVLPGFSTPVVEFFTM